METFEVTRNQNQTGHTTVYCTKSADCEGGVVFKTKLSCGCCFCEKGCEICEWHSELNHKWS